MTDPLPRIRRGGLRTAVVSLFLAIQVFLAFHQLEHGLKFSLQAEDCALCQVTSNLIPTPEPAVSVAPVANIYVHPLPTSDRASKDVQLVAYFQSRAPPAFFS